MTVQILKFPVVVKRKAGVVSTLSKFLALFTNCDCVHCVTFRQLLEKDPEAAHEYLEKLDEQ